MNRRHRQLAASILCDRQPLKYQEETVVDSMVDHRRDPFLPSFLRSQSFIAYGEMNSDDWNQIRHGSL